MSLVTATTLSFPIPNALFFLSTDFSNVAVDATLEQTVDGNSRPLGFFSRKSNVVERNYSIFDSKLLAIYLTVWHFWHLLGSNHFTINHLDMPSPRPKVRGQPKTGVTSQPSLKTVAPFIMFPEEELRHRCFIENGV